MRFPLCKPFPSTFHVCSSVQMLMSAPCLADKKAINNFEYWCGACYMFLTALHAPRAWIQQGALFQRTDLLVLALYRVLILNYEQPCNSTVVPPVTQVIQVGWKAIPHAPFPLLSLPINK